MVSDDLKELISAIANVAKPGDQVLIMSNAGFDETHEKLLKKVVAG